MINNGYPENQVETFKDTSKFKQFKDYEYIPTGWKYGVVDC